MRRDWEFSSEDFFEALRAMKGKQRSLISYITRAELDYNIKELLSLMICIKSSKETYEGIEVEG